MNTSLQSPVMLMCFFFSTKFLLLHIDIEIIGHIRHVGGKNLFQMMALAITDEFWNAFECEEISWCILYILHIYCIYIYMHSLHEFQLNWFERIDYEPNNIATYSLFDQYVYICESSCT